MFKFLNIFVVLCVFQTLRASPYDPNKIKEWGQCGGIGYKGKTECQPWLKCYELSDWFHQCLKEKPSPSPQTSALSSTITIPTTRNNDPFYREWDQCGGIGFVVEKQCTVGLVCESINDWFYQCRRPRYKVFANIYEQCGGVSFKGKTECAIGLKCVFINDWYSQCLPFYEIKSIPNTQIIENKSPKLKDLDVTESDLN
ncbi:unnamed protein product [Brachionus calyciflorus]|uniref:CBM1 domain-containing protein n=1 Tax=Brachionus calyciflorus TaxID=104777 RepID=A0A814E6M0_9BILA|nr:unnamed protein product [Brachionus calyciflorus]